MSVGLEDQLYLKLLARIRLNIYLVLHVGSICSGESPIAPAAARDSPGNKTFTNSRLNELTNKEIYISKIKNNSIQPKNKDKSCP